MTEKQKLKMWKYASKTNYRAECFENDYSEKLEIVVCSIFNQKMSEEGWKNLWDKLKTEPYDSALCFQLLAMAQNKDCPTNIVEEIIDLVSKIVTKEDNILRLNECIVESALSRELSPKTNEMIYKKFGTTVAEMCEKMARYNEHYMNHYTKPDIHESNVNQMATLFLRRKALLRNYTRTPYHFMTDDALAKSIIESDKSNEVVRTGLCANTNLPESTRNMAFDHPEGVYIQLLQKSATPHMLETMYWTAVDAFTEQEVNPLTYHQKGWSKIDKKPYEDAMYFIRSLIIDGKLTETMEIDLFNRLVGLKAKEKNTVLESLLHHTKCKYIIDNVNRIASYRDREAIYNNPNISDELRNKRVDEYMAIYNKKKGKVPNYLMANLESICYNQTVKDEVYEVLINNGHCIREMSENPLTPDKYLLQIAREYEHYTIAKPEHYTYSQQWERRISPVAYTMLMAKSTIESDKAKDLIRALVSVQSFPQKGVANMSSIKETFVIKRMGDYDIANFRILFEKIKPEELEAFKNKLKAGISEHESGYMRCFCEVILEDLEIAKKMVNEKIEKEARVGYLDDALPPISKFRSNVAQPFAENVANNPLNLFLKIEDYTAEGIPMMEKIIKNPTQDYSTATFLKFHEGFESNYKTSRFDEER